MTGQEKEALRGLLHGHFVTFPVMVFGMLGGDPNDFTTDEYVTIAGWLDELGYVRRAQRWFEHAHLMSIWTREEAWPGERPEDRRPYAGIPLARDPDLAFTPEDRAERKARRREFNRYIAGL